MGVYSYCVSSTVTIKEANSKAALKALKKGVKEYSFFDSLNLEFCTSLGEAIEKLDMTYDLEEKDLTNIQFKGGKGDNSMFIWPLLSEFIEDGSEIIMEHEGEREITEFREGKFETCCGEEDFDDWDDEDECRSEAVEALFENIEDGVASEKDLDYAIEKEGHLNFLNYSGNTPLMEAIQNTKYISSEEQLSSTLNLIRNIINRGVDLNYINKQGDNAISLAVRCGQEDLVRELITLGVSLHSDGMKDLFEEAAKNCDIEMSKLLQNAGLKRTEENISLLVACQSREGKRRRMDFVRWLVEEQSVDVNTRLSTRFESNNLEMNSGATALMFACCEGNKDLVDYLLERGADASVLDIKRNSALHYASGQVWPEGECYPVWGSNKKKLEIINNLLKEVSQVGTKNLSGKSPYLLAKKDFKKAIPIYRDFLSSKGVMLPVELNEELNGPIEFAKNEQPVYRVNFKNGKLDGEQIFYHNNGNKFSSVEYKDGVASGNYMAWKEDGTQFFDASCLDGKWHGCIKMLTPKGSVGQELNYDKGIRHGRQMMTTEDGTLILEAFYEKGRKNGRFYYQKPDGEVVLDEEFENDVVKSDESEKNEETNPLMGLFGALLGGNPKSTVTTLMLEEKMRPSSKLFFNNPKKVMALFEKTQDSLLDNL